jgi:hypothetical protein
VHSSPVTPFPRAFRTLALPYILKKSGQGRTDRALSRSSPASPIGLEQAECQGVFRTARFAGHGRGVAGVNKFLANELAYWGALAKANGLTVQ